MCAAVAPMPNPVDTDGEVAEWGPQRVTPIVGVTVTPHFRLQKVKNKKAEDFVVEGDAVVQMDSEDQTNPEPPEFHVGEGDVKGRMLDLAAYRDGQRSRCYGFAFDGRFDGTSATASPYSEAAGYYVLSINIRLRVKREGFSLWPKINIADPKHTLTFFSDFFESRRFDHVNTKVKVIDNDDEDHVVYVVDLLLKDRDFFFDISGLLFGSILLSAPTLVAISLMHHLSRTDDFKIARTGQFLGATLVKVAKKVQELGHGLLVSLGVLCISLFLVAASSGHIKLFLAIATTTVSGLLFVAVVASGLDTTAWGLPSAGPAQRNHDVFSLPAGEQHDPDEVSATDTELYTFHNDDPNVFVGKRAASELLRIQRRTENERDDRDKAISRHAFAVSTNRERYVQFE